MKFTYRYVTGEVVEVEVEDKLGEQIAAIEHESELKDRAETRRHQSVEWSSEQGIQFADLNTDIESELEQAESEQERQQQFEKLLQSINQLLPQQRELVQKIFGEGQKMAEIARQEGVSAKAIQDRVNKIKIRLKNILEKS